MAHHPSTETTDLPDDHSVDSNDRNESLTMEECGMLMREQDAELLESMRRSRFLSSGGGNTMSSFVNTEEIPETDATERRLSRKSSRVGDEEPMIHEPTRRALSGDVWFLNDEATQNDEWNNDKSNEYITTSESKQTDENQNDQVKISESEDRRLNEAAQFAEAVGDIPPKDQDELRIIDDEEGDVVEDDDDDDDNAPVVRVERRDPAHPVNLPTESLHGSPLTPKKTRPVWPHRGILDKLPDNGTTQNYVYKGLRANPPDIVKRGISRGNYAQLHRKAWLEVSDKYHRYGKNLRLYYRHWESLGCPTNMFFDWLDSKGEAAGQPLPEIEECPRAKLDSDTVLYISNPDVTAGYAIKFVPDENGRGQAIDVDGDPICTGEEGWIFVLRDNVMYAAQKVTSVTGHSKQRFHHSSFFGGKAVAAAGIFITDDEGFLTRLYPHSGHYRPGEANMQRMLFYLYNEGVDLRTFEMDTQQILHVSREVIEMKNDKDGAAEKKKKAESLHLVPAVEVACFLAHKARFIEIFEQIHRIRTADVASVSEAVRHISSTQQTNGENDQVS